MSKKATCDHGYSGGKADESAPHKAVMARLYNACLLDIDNVKLEEIMLDEASRSWQLMDETLHKMVVASALKMLTPKDKVVVLSKVTPSQLVNFAMVVLHIEEAMSHESSEKAQQKTDTAMDDLTCMKNICRFFYCRAPCSCFDAYYDRQQDG